MNFCYIHYQENDSYRNAPPPLSPHCSDSRFPIPDSRFPIPWAIA
ncbi:hypothetical protein [Moorena sp. SIOASIH]|nr:hypothetical protein [Moorena sp. SIOASIH]